MGSTLATPDNKRAAEVALLEAVGIYLESIGWKAFVASVMGIQHQPAESAVNYELIINFTGGQKQKERRKNATPI